MSKSPYVFVQLDEGAFMPERAHDTDAGADLRCREDFVVKAGKSVMIDTGVHVCIPPFTKCEIKSKSSLNVLHGIITTGLVDEGFSGTILVRVYNLGEDDYYFKRGDKVTQICVSSVKYPEFVQVEKVKGGERGDNGYGSTGR